MRGGGSASVPPQGGGRVDERQHERARSVIDALRMAIGRQDKPRSLIGPYRSRQPGTRARIPALALRPVKREQKCPPIMSYAMSPVALFIAIKSAAAGQPGIRIEDSIRQPSNSIPEGSVCLSGNHPDFGIGETPT